MQPTDQCVRSVFVFPQNTEAGRRNERESRDKLQGLVVPMKDRIVRLVMSLGAVAAMAIAGGASFKGW